MPRPTLSCLVQRHIDTRKLRLPCLCAAVFFAQLCLSAAKADTTNQLWSVHAFGLKVGELTLEMDESAERYKGAGSFQTTGLAGVLRSIRFTVSGAGTRNGSDLKPAKYDGYINTGKRVSETSLVAKNDLLIKTKGAQSPATPIAPNRTKGALDPMSMMWLSLRDQTDATLCQIEQTQFDGTRLVRITLKTRQPDGDSVTCSGTYDRIGGYSDEELAELKTSPLSVTYSREGEFWRATEVRLTSRHGRAKLIRRD
ncbi:DUF3108 domain-containing protein [Shimia sp. R10_1]|uniref:DUF3108 domain-containing protein n=1 Tax=Shimia sp. R10_1 TaxID=2821095 RepID=UPI0024682FB0|nr:DUF3108 domain-containing protein [Shimia sp. R10_1]